MVRFLFIFKPALLVGRVVPATALGGPEIPRSVLVVLHAPRQGQRRNHTTWSLTYLWGVLSWALPAELAPR